MNVIYMHGIMVALDIDIETVMMCNKFKLQERYEGHYSNSSAQARADKA